MLVRYAGCSRHGSLRPKAPGTCPSSRTSLHWVLCSVHTLRLCTAHAPRRSQCIMMYMLQSKTSHSNPKCWRQVVPQKNQLSVHFTAEYSHFNYNVPSLRPGHW